MSMSYHGVAGKMIAPVPDASAEQTIGKLLLDAGKLTPQHAEQVLRLQKAEGLRFGDAAIKLGLIDESDLRQALARQFEYPYLPGAEGGFSQELVAAYQPFGAQVELLRALRSQLMLRWFAAGRKTLAISGANAGEGASYLAANLAVVFSQLGERTLLIDADLRKPRQHTIFNLGNRPGLSDMLVGRANQGAAVSRISNFVDLSVLTAGAVPPNPAELLSRAALPVLLGELAESFDVILIDTPPAGMNADALTIAARAAGAMMVIRQNHTRLDVAAAHGESLRAAGVELAGAVLNQF